jgi:DNA polymerase-1
VHDTDLLSRCVLGADNGPFGLKHLATVYLDSDAADEEKAMREVMVSMGLIKKADQKRMEDGAYYKAWLAYPDVVEKYALKDTRYTYDLLHVMLDKATPQDLEVYALEQETMPVVIRMEHRGVAIDPTVVDALHEKFSDAVVTAQAALRATAEDPEFNPDSNEQVADLLVSKGIPLSQTTDTGQLRVDKWALEKFSDHPLVDVVLSERTNSKFLSTYIDPMVGRDVVHASVWQIGARTGRMSYSRPNLQNLPVRSGPEIREMFVPRPGCALIVADYSSIELRLLAYYMADDRLWGIINDGDPFLWLGEQIYGTPDQEAWPVKRQPLKNGFYAMTYGAGGPKLAQTIGGGMTADEGRELARKIKAVLGAPYRVLNQRIRKQIESNGYVRTLANRTQYVPRDRSYVGLNALIQGSAADIMKQGLVNAAEELSMVGGYPLLAVHDEILAEVPLDHVNEGLERLCTAMELAYGGFRLKVEGSVCYTNYGEGK